jgi:ankyrin repeat protein
MADKGDSAGSFGLLSERSPLFAAAHGGHTDVVKILLQKGAKAGVGQSFGPFGLLMERTPLIAAVRQGHVDVVEALLDSGASPASGLSFGPFGILGTVAPISLAAAMDRSSLVRLLLEKCSDTTNSKGKSCVPNGRWFRWAIRKSSYTVSKVLLTRRKMHLVYFEEEEMIMRPTMFFSEGNKLNTISQLAPMVVQLLLHEFVTWTENLINYIKSYELTIGAFSIGMNLEATNLHTVKAAYYDESCAGLIIICTIFSVYYVARVALHPVIICCACAMCGLVWHGWYGMVWYVVSYHKLRYRGHCWLWDFAHLFLVGRQQGKWFGLRQWFETFNKDGIMYLVPGIYNLYVHWIAFNRLVRRIRYGPKLGKKITTRERKLQQRVHAAAITNAIACGDTELVKAFLKSDIPIQKNVLLQDAVTNGSVEMVRALLENGAHPNGGWTLKTANPLGVAAANGRLDVVNILLKKGASPNDKTILSAATKGHSHIVYALLEKGPIVNGTHLLSAVAALGSMEMVNAVLDKGAKPDTQTLLAAATIGSTEMVRAFLDKGAKPDTQTLLAAATIGSTEMVRAFLERGAKPDEHHEGKHVKGHRSPLFAAAANGHLDVVNLLLEKGADPNTGPYTLFPYTNSPLNVAIRNGHASIVQTLLKHGASPDLGVGIIGFECGFDRRCDQGEVMSLTVMVLTLSIIVMFLACLPFTAIPQVLGVERVWYGRILWFFFCICEGLVLLCSLVLNIYLIYLTFNLGIQLDFMLASKPHVDIVEANEVGHNRRNRTLICMQTPLFAAASMGNVEIVRQLLAKGASRDSGFTVGPLGVVATCSPLYVAAYNGHTDVVDALLSQGARPDAGIAIGLIEIHYLWFFFEITLTTLQIFNTSNDRWKWITAAFSGGFYIICNLILLCIGSFVVVCVYYKSAASKGVRMVQLKKNCDGTLPISLCGLVHAQTPLFIAAYRGHLEATKVLLANDANVNIGMTIGPLGLISFSKPQWVAALNGHAEIGKTLLDREAKYLDKIDNGAKKVWVFDTVMCVRYSLPVARCFAVLFHAPRLGAYVYWVVIFRMWALLFVAGLPRLTPYMLCCGDAGLEYLYGTLRRRFSTLVTSNRRL